MIYINRNEFENETHKKLACGRFNIIRILDEMYGAQKIMNCYIKTKHEKNKWNPIDGCRIGSSEDW